MVPFVIMLLFLCSMGLLSETLCSLTLEAEPGDKVTIWCRHNLNRSGYILWFKQYLITASSASVPVIVGCKQFTLYDPSQKCYFFTENERIVMSVQGKNTSLTITAVNLSDTGLYYCSFMQLNQMTFSNSTYLHVKEGNETLSKISDSAKGCVCSGVFFMLTVVFGAVIVILLCLLIFIILKHRKTHRGPNAEAQVNKEQEPDSVNYAALKFSKKKTKKAKRHGDMVDPHVVYSSIRQ